MQKCPVCKLLTEREKAGWELAETRATVIELRHLLDSMVWRDIQDTIVSWLIALRDELEEMGEGVDRNEISFAQGRLAALRLVLHLPTALIVNKEELNEQQNQSDRRPGDDVGDRS